MTSSITSNELSVIPHDSGPSSLNAFCSYEEQAGPALSFGPVWSYETVAEQGSSSHRIS